MHLSYKDISVSIDISKACDKVEEDIFLFVLSILPGLVSPLYLASPVAFALFLFVLFSAVPPIPPLSSAENTRRQTKKTSK